MSLWGSLISDTVKKCTMKDYVGQALIFIMILQPIGVYSLDILTEFCKDWNISCDGGGVCCRSLVMMKLKVEKIKWLK